MAIFTELQPLIDRLQNQLQKSVKDEFPSTLKDPIYYFLESPGKKIRPLLTLLSCEAVGGGYEDALQAAVGIELFHDFTLIHDDIMDRDDLRRGRYTVHKKWGEESAILVGDALIGLSYEKMMECKSQYLSKVIRLFNEALLKVCEGQALDKEFENRQHVDLNDYLNMISKKTAWLFKLSCQIGAILGGGSPDQVDLMTQFGYFLGMGFQIQDDLLDYMGEENTLGKKIGSDLKMDKKTYITLKYREHILKNNDLKSSYPQTLSQYNKITKVKNALIELGIARETENVVNQYIESALDLLKGVQPLTEENKLFQMVLALQKRQY